MATALNFELGIVNWKSTKASGLIISKLPNQIQRII